MEQIALEWETRGLPEESPIALATDAAREVVEVMAEAIVTVSRPQGGER